MENIILATKIYIKEIFLKIKDKGKVFIIGFKEILSKVIGILIECLVIWFIKQINKKFFIYK